MKKANLFSRVATQVSHYAGRPAVFMTAAGSVLVWAVVGPLFDYSEGWQLTINTGTTIVTFLMVFLIQNTQNRDAAAVQIKLDELIRATKAAHNSLLDLEELSESDIESFRRRYMKLAEKAREAGMSDDEIEEDAGEPPMRKKRVKSPAS